ncbi:MAG: hypothetical protein JWL61_1296 [Gemmatimonadetes bacterium]|nr:hypothetical protein [Gemmatimonadota bacterium]
MLAAWESFYVIVGSSGAALTGLQFVVIALVSETRGKSSSDQIDTFATPTIVHFCAVLYIAAVLSAPWSGLQGPQIALGLAGAVGVIYAFITMRRARRQTGYKLVLEDWIWHTFLTLVAYAALLSGGMELKSHTEASLFAIGATSMLLLFIGIHNAWDTVTYIAVERMAAPAAEKAPPPQQRSVPKKKGRR